MSISEQSVGDGPIVFCLHYLGGSAREWAAVGSMLRNCRSIGLDLPGFGDANATPGYSVSEMATTIAETVRSHAPARWLLAGHSMGAKVAAALARRIEDGSLDVPGLQGLVLLAGSPPSPEPMPDEQRHKMLGMFAGDAESRRADARDYVDENSEHLEASARSLAIEDALRMNRAAWVAWLESGSREDWSQRIGVLQTPALILAGADDPALGPDAQQKLMVPHFSRVRFMPLEATKHLLPLRRPREVAAAIDEFVRSLPADLPRPTLVPQPFRELIASDRVSAKTREALLARGEPDDTAYEAAALDARAFATLRAVVRRVVPQAGPGAADIDLAARIDKALASGDGDGWRFAILPEDARAYGGALHTLEAIARHDGHDFAELGDAAQDAILSRIAAGNAVDGERSNGAPSGFSSAQMRAWFEDLRADAVRAYLGHPATFARLGYSGFAYGGDGELKSGFARIGPGEREAWEPVAAMDANK